MQVKEALEARFPGIEVNGGPYPVAPLKVATYYIVCCPDSGEWLHQA